MYIKKVELKNFKNLRDFEQEFEGAIYLVTGENERGKSSFLQAIAMCLKGEKNKNILTQGEEKGFAKVIVGDDDKEYEIKLAYTKENPEGTMTIKGPDGMSSRNKGTIEKICNFTDFDAVEFCAKSATADGRKKQMEDVEAVMPEEVVKAIKEIKERIIILMDERKAANSDANSLTKLREAAEKDMPGNPEEYQKPISIAELYEELTNNEKLCERKQKAEEGVKIRTAEIEAIPVKIKEAKEQTEKYLSDLQADTAEHIFQIKAEAEKRVKEAQEKFEAEKAKAEESLKSTIAELEANKADSEQKLQNCKNFIAEFEAQGIQPRNKAEETAKAEAHNKKCDAVAKVGELRAKEDEAKNKANGLTEEIKNKRAELENLIKTTDLPVKGLSFDENGLTLNGIPFADGLVSDSQKMEVAIGLALASNPTTKIIRISRGESLGGDKLRAICETASKMGFQGFIEEVRRNQDDLIIEEITEN